MNSDFDPGAETPQTRHVVRRGDARVLPGVDPASVDLVVTSPPYPMIEMWDSLFSALEPSVAGALESKNGPRAFEAMHRVLDAVWLRCAEALRPGGIMCINIGDATRSIGSEFALYPNHARVIQSCMAQHLTPLPTILWKKPTNAPNKFMGSGMLPPGAYVTLGHEHVLVFRKGGKKKYDDDQHRQRRRESAYFWEERNAWFSDEWRFRGERQAAGALEIERRTAAFPIELPCRLIQMFSSYEEVILDPFVGTGTTSLAAMALARNSVGIETEPDLCRLASARLLSADEDVRSLPLERLQRHVEEMTRRIAGGKLPRYENPALGVRVVTRQEIDLRLYRLREVRREDHSTCQANYAAVRQDVHAPSPNRLTLADYEPPAPEVRIA